MELTSPEIERLMLGWDQFRTTMLGFVVRYDLILCPVADEPAVPRRGTDTECRAPYEIFSRSCAEPLSGVSANRYRGANRPVGCHVPTWAPVNATLCGPVIAVDRR